jgi:hypothetical protein
MCSSIPGKDKIFVLPAKPEANQHSLLLLFSGCCRQSGLGKTLTTVGPQLRMIAATCLHGLQRDKLTFTVFSLLSSSPPPSSLPSDI